MRVDALPRVGARSIVCVQAGNVNTGAIDPVGAIAEPYALWAIERRVGMDLPCAHEQIVITDDLRRYAQLKLFFLNLGHTWLADQWLSENRASQETVLQAMNTPRVRSGLETVWHDEVLPVFSAMGLQNEAETYIDSVRERFLNPFLAHRLSDIAANHREKIRRRILPLVEMADSQSLPLTQPRLRRLLVANNLLLDGEEVSRSS